MEIDERLEDYYTATECDSNIEEELDTQFENYYTVEECDRKSVLIGWESGGGKSSGSGLARKIKGNSLSISFGR
jgi:hypothetical protein